MRYFGGYSQAEIAGALGVTERTVRRDWHKARLVLQVALKQLGQCPQRDLNSVCNR
ncbi:MAG: hypothetical protein H7337_22505 [Rhizobacter sp.]|nr:hypothetical protein [Rhizobacter sp.]